MDNLDIYNKAREVPQEAQKIIKGGRLSGMTDINPMWRIKKLTELFGPCGFGWKYEIVDKRLEEGSNNEIAAFVDINLYVKKDGKWSESIQGTGGSSFVAKERKGLYTSDECFKMALTDAISIACKALGFGADIYWSKDRTKYSNPKPPKQKISKNTVNEISNEAKKSEKAKEYVMKCLKKSGYNSSKDLYKLSESEGIDILEGLKEVM